MNKNIKKINFSEELVRNTKKRDAFDKVCEFIDNKQCLRGRILALYGLRRTGKTFLLAQIKSKYRGDAEHLEFPLIADDGTPQSFSMSDVYNAIDECTAAGKTIILLDEITNVEDFTYDSEILADDYAVKGISIIIAGTDSLGLKLAGNNPLLGRKPDIPMTYISFAEYYRVFGIDDIDNYIKTGGLMHEGVYDDSVTDIISKQRYLDSAVSGNIVRSLMRYKKYSSDSTNYDEICKYTENDIKQIVNKFVAIYGGSFEPSKINSKKEYNIIDFPLKRYRNSFGVCASLQIDSNRKKISSDYAKLINSECILSKPASAELMRELENLLYILGVFSSLDVHRYEKIDSVWQNAKTEKEGHIIQPAIKYYQLKEAQKIYLESADLDELSFSEREFLSQKLEEKIFGDMVEAIVQFDVSCALDSNNYCICKPELYVDGKSIGEYDMLIYDKSRNSYYGFEVKHTNNPYSGQYKNLNNSEITNVLDYQYGERKNVSVLYRGDPFQTVDGVFYLNIADFLRTVDKYRDMDVAMDKLTENLPVRDLEQEEADIDAHQTKQDVRSAPSLISESSFFAKSDSADIKVF